MNKNNRAQPWLAWGLLLLLLVTVAIVVVAPAIKARQLNQAHGEKLRFIEQKLQRTLGQGQPERAPTPQSTALLFGRKPEALLAADIQTIISREVEHLAGNLISVQTTRSELTEKLGKVSLLVNLRTDVAGMVKLLDKLASHKPLLIVEEPQIHVRQLHARQNESQKQESLDVRFKLSGFYQESTGENG